MKKKLLLFLTILGLSTLMFGQTTLFNYTFAAAEGFTTTNGVTPAPVSANTWMDNGSGFGFINADGANQINNIFTSPTMAITYPAQGAVYDLKFSWYVNDKSLCYGTGTDPLLGPVDFTDVTVKYYTSTNGGSTWSSGTSIWVDDTVNFSNITNNTYYPRTFRLSVAGTVNAIKAEFTYVGANGSNFRIDNVQLIQTNNPEFVFTPKSPFDNNQVYTQIPLKQVKEYQSNIGVTITNNGIAAFADAQLDLYYNTYSYRYDYAAIVQGDFVAPYPKSKTYGITSKSAGKTIKPSALGTVFIEYDIANINGNAYNKNYSISVNDSVYAKDNNTYSNFIPYSPSSPSVGHIYQVVNPAKLTTFSVRFTNDGALSNEMFTFSIYSIASMADTSGLTLVYQSGEILRGNTGGLKVYEIPDQTLAAGNYLVLINQVGTANLKIGYDNSGTNGSYVRYSATATKKVFSVASDPKGNAIIRLNFNSTAPEFVTTQIDFNNNKPIAGMQYSFTVKTRDKDGDAIQLLVKPNSSTWLNTWYTFTDNGNGTATITGTPPSTATNDTVWVVIKQGTVRVDSFIYKLAQVVSNSPASINYTQAFGSTPAEWVFKPYAMSNQHWFVSGGYAQIGSDLKDTTQNEMYITPAFKLASNADSAYQVKFAWYATNVTSIIGGDKNDLGSLNPVKNDYNNADINLRVSTLESGVWSAWSTPIWEEDDSVKIRTSSYTGSSYSGTTMPYPYNSFTIYYTLINFTKLYPAYKGKTVRFAFEYKGIRKWATAPSNSFLVDQFNVELMSVVPDLKVTAIKPFENTYIPSYQMVPTDLKSIVRNIGTKKCKSTYLVTKVDSSGVTIYSNQTSLGDINGGDSVIVSPPQFTLKGKPSSISYTVSHTLTPTAEEDADTYGGANSDSYVFTTTEPDDNELVMSNLSTSTGVYLNKTTALGTTNRIGTVFTLNKPDYFSGFEVLFYTYSSYYGKFSYTILKNASDNKSGTVVYTSNEYNIGAIWNQPTLTPTAPVLLSAGTYTLVMNQADASAGVAVYRDAKAKGYYMRVSDDNKMWKDTTVSAGYLYTRIYFSNTAPSFITSSSDVNLIKAKVGVPYSFTLSAKDDFNKYTYSVVTAPTWLSLAHDGITSTAVISGTPPATAEGTNGVEIKVKDDRGNEAMLNFFINVATNPAPYFTSSPVTTAKEGVTYSYSISASDAFGDALTLTAEKVPSWLTFAANNTAKTATLTGTTPVVGTHTVQLKVTDANSKVAYQIFEISVAKADVAVTANKAPKFTSAANSIGTQGTLFSLAITTSDENGDAVSVTAASKPSWLTLTGTTLSGTPTADNIGENRVVLVANDGKVSVEQVVNITIKATNAAPVISSTAITTAEAGVTYAYNITATDADNQTLYIKVINMPTWLTLISKGNGKALLTGTPGAENVTSNNAVSITVTDGVDVTAQTFTITVAAASNAAPVISSTAVTTATVGTTYTYNVTATDGDGNALRFSARTLPAWLSIVENLNGTAKISGTPGTVNIGDNVVSVTVTDGKVVTEQKFTIKVSAAASSSKSLTEVYPNPNGGTLTIETAGQSTINIFNSNGKLVGSYKGSSDISSIDMSKYENGIYYIKIVAADGTITNKVITLVK